ncbi:hypothetical protein GCM10007049_30390 [Echinicola pacifica]|uniref:Phosphate-selective porin O and P n=1 Tax=Echinicola pacifica TaxID=346377 RepID=A0A918Q7H7_9BACT|nr:hypothetical protein [Echinicola pacifica]GGZ34910.1 hypothetical protein GCM10007049_30390 [Echinicola pacifica]
MFRIFLIASMLCFMAGPLLGQERFLSVQSADSLAGKPRFSSSLGVNMKLNGYLDLFGGLQDSETFNVGSINVFGHDDSKSLKVDMYQTQIKWATDLMLPDGRMIQALVETDFWAGEGALRLRRAFVETTHWQVGQNWNNFGDEVLWPNIMEWEGPPSGVWQRTPHVKYKNTFRNPALVYELSLEAPINELDHFEEVQPFLEEANQYIPDFTAAFKARQSWGHIRLASVWRSIRYRLDSEDGSFLGYGFSLSGIHRNDISKNNFQFQLVGGQGITAYMTSITGQGYDGFPSEDGTVKATPVFGGWTSYEYFFTPKFHANMVLGYTRFFTKNSDRYFLFPEEDISELYLEGDVYHMHYYGIFNIMYEPYERMTIGLEMDYGAKRLSADGLVNGNFIDQSKTRDAMRISFGFMFYY